MEEEYQEITLADIVRTLFRRKLVLISVFLLCVVGGTAVTVFTEPEYESTASIAPLAHPDVIKNWLDSRNASAHVVEAIGLPLQQQLFPDRWDPQTLDWTTGAPTLEESAIALRARTDVRIDADLRFASFDRFLTVTVTLGDPGLARETADAYIGTLEVIRPILENIEEQNAFDKYYDGSNEEEAQRRAKQVAQQKDYWLSLDKAETPRSPSSPNLVLNVALSVVLGVMLGVFSVFALEWMKNFKAEGKAPEVPPEVDQPSTEPEKSPRKYS